MGAAFEILLAVALITTSIAALVLLLRFLFGWRIGRRRDRLEHLYDEWMDDIANDQRFSLQSLIEHVHHHTSEATTEGMSGEWLASMENLIEIIRRKEQLFHPTLRHKLERLYLHWRQDPQNNTPPPITKSMRRLMRALPDPPDPQPAPQVQRTEVDRQQRVETREDTFGDYSRWHGS
jgi:hypothetical protein